MYIYRYAHIHKVSNEGSSIVFLLHRSVTNELANKLLSVESRCVGNTHAAGEEEGISPCFTAEGRETKRKKIKKKCSSE